MFIAASTRHPPAERNRARVLLRRTDGVIGDPALTRPMRCRSLRSLLRWIRNASSTTRASPRRTGSPLSMPGQSAWNSSLRSSTGLTLRGLIAASGESSPKESQLVCKSGPQGACPSGFWRARAGYFDCRSPPYGEGINSPRRATTAPYEQGLLRKIRVSVPRRHVSEGVARRRSASRVPQMCPKCVRVFREQTTINARFAGTLGKPSDGLEPSTPSLPWRCSTN